MSPILLSFLGVRLTHICLMHIFTDLIPNRVITQNEISKLSNAINTNMNTILDSSTTVSAALSYLDKQSHIHYCSIFTEH